MACFCPFNRRNREGQKKEGESRESQEKQGRERERVAESEQREGRREGRSRAARERRGGGRCQAVGHPAQGPSLPSTMLTPRARRLLSRRRTESNPCPGDPGVGAPGRVLEGLQEGRGTGEPRMGRWGQGGQKGGHWPAPPPESTETARCRRQD